MLNQIKAKMESQLGHGVEVTFISATMFSILCDDAAQFAKVKEIMSRISTAQFDSDDECGHCAYYNY